MTSSTRRLSRLVLLISVGLVLTGALPAAAAERGPRVLEEPRRVGIDTNRNGSDDLWVDVTAWANSSTGEQANVYTSSPSSGLVSSVGCVRGVRVEVTAKRRGFAMRVYFCHEGQGQDRVNVFRFVDSNGDGTTDDPGEFIIVALDADIKRD